MNATTVKSIGSILLLAAMLGCGGGQPSSDEGSHAAHAQGIADAPKAAAPNDATFDVVVTPQGELRAGERTQIVFDPRVSSGERVGELAIVHEKPFHLLMVSRDLSYFAHEHPEVRSDGTLALDFAFPRPGEYVLFGDFKPKDAPGQVVRKTLVVPGEAPPPTKLVVDERAHAKTFGDVSVSLAPPKLTAREDVFLEFTLDRGGQPVDDIRPYLGAMGHCVIIGEDATTFLHSHPQGGDAPGTHVIRFHTVFPTPGLYKAWGQFDVGGQMVIADFVLDVAGEGTAKEPAPHHDEHPHH